ncbi:TonB-dependent receptor [Pedobacter sp. MC2016-14]|uniref:TonB-dependent receptor n=1 Tax=Pedobacter sp. MC2016-14 TaxID=2897327 RepID=UPI001E627D6B|nr:carboxypeptidase-like regulatory domain-containing protein [Pedobacter sp. MC2016-14]MCD0487482.1 TonB-dependent receptor [Pedobacter sp. MC2016-14]
MHKTLLLILLSFITISVKAQTGTLSGKVTDEHGKPVSGASVLLKELSRGTMTDDNGKYELKSLQPGEYTLVVSSIETQQKNVKVKIERVARVMNISVKNSDDKALDQVTIAGKTVKKQMETSGFAVAVIETKEASLRNLTTNELLDRTVGVRVRQNGGVGSNVDYNLNGMSGSTVGIFIDGIEASTYGSSFNLNNIPPAMIERIEVYKGVLPSHLSGDYVGGAINVVLKKDASHNNVTVAMSYGSFNTYNADASLIMRDKKTGLSFRGSGFYTYSDNSYEMWGKFSKYTDRNGKLIRDFKARRFNDTFKSIGGRFELGFTDVKWADQFFIGYNVSDAYKEIPHGTTTALPYVGRFTEYQAQVVGLNYSKKNLFVDGLALNINAVRSNRDTYVQDTVTTQYNWDGNPIILHTDYMIENGNPPIVLKYPRNAAQQGAPEITQVNRKITNSRANLSYTIVSGHRVSLDHKFEMLDRDDTNLLLPVNKDFMILSQIIKNIVTANYESQIFGDKLRSNAFIKYTANTTNQIDPEPVIKTDGSYTINPVTNRTFNDNIGYGATISYNIKPKLFLIASMNNGYVMPTEEQMFGSPESNTLRNLSLKPEHSINYNIGFRWGSLEFNKHKLSFYSNIFWRNRYDRITRQTVDSIQTDSDLDIRATAFVNIDEQSRGLEAEVIYVFNNKLNAVFNFSKFNALYKRKYDGNGKPDERHNLQIPNEPFFTINANLQYRFDNILQKKSITNLYYSGGYVGAYDIAWHPSEGSLTPAQFAHDLGVSHRFPSGRLIASLDAKNVFNSALYDNFGVQKPGRGVYFKLNYTIGKF